MSPEIYVEPCGYQQLTVSTTAVALTLPPGAVRALITVESQPIRFRDDKIDPTASIGMPILAGTTFTLSSRLSSVQFRAIRSGASDAILSISYYR